MMKALFAGYTLVAVMVTSALAEDLTFRLYNETSSDLTGFYISPSGQNQWGANLLQGGYLAPDFEVPVLISDDLEVCEYDIRGEFRDGQDVEDYDIDICETSEYTFQN